MRPFTLLIIAAGLFLGGVAIGLEKLCSENAYSTHLDRALHPPSRVSLLGTDELGRDQLARTGLATGLALRGAGIALAIAGTLAIVLGGIAGWWRGAWPDACISWVIALLHTVPFLLIVAAIAAVVQPTWAGIYTLVGCVAWATPARLVRAEVMRVRTARHVTTMKAFGTPPWLLLRRAALPVAAPPVLLSLLMFLPELVVLDVALSFFGLGAQPPVPTLGRLIYQGFSRLGSAPWLSLLPVLCLVLLCGVVHWLGTWVHRLIPSQGG